MCDICTASLLLSIVFIAQAFHFVTIDRPKFFCLICTHYAQTKFSYYWGYRIDNIHQEISNYVGKTKLSSCFVLCEFFLFLNNMHTFLNKTHNLSRSKFATSPIFRSYQLLKIIQKNQMIKLKSLKWHLLFYFFFSWRFVNFLHDVICNFRKYK